MRGRLTENVAAVCSVVALVLALDREGPGSLVWAALGFAAIGITVVLYVRRVRSDHRRQASGAGWHDET